MLHTTSVSAIKNFSKSENKSDPPLGDGFNVLIGLKYLNKL